MRLICFGARGNEHIFFTELNHHGFELTLVEDLLTTENVNLVTDHEAVMLRGNCNAQLSNLIKMRSMGVKYLLTRTVGYDHIDLNQAKKLGLKVARVPGYSPNAIAELSLTMVMMLLRHVAQMVSFTSKADFRVMPNYFSKEIRHQTVAIIGVGKIGLTSASLFSGLGAKIIGNDPYPSEDAKKIVTFMSLDELTQEADIIILHTPYIKGENDHMINDHFLSKVKPHTILVNVARGEIVDTSAVLNALNNNQLAAFATDVLEGELSIFNKNFEGGSTTHSVIDQLINLYPRVLITPHVGSNTDEACRNMIEQSYDNLMALIKTGHCINSL